MLPSALQYPWPLKKVPGGTAITKASAENGAGLCYVSKHYTLPAWFPGLFLCCAQRYFPLPE